METSTETPTMIDLELRKFCVDAARAKKPIKGIVDEARKLYEWLEPYDWCHPASREQIIDFELRKWCALCADADDPTRQLEGEEKKLYAWVTNEHQRAGRE